MPLWQNLGIAKEQKGHFSQDMKHLDDLLVEYLEFRKNKAVFYARLESFKNLINAIVLLADQIDYFVFQSLDMFDFSFAFNPYFFRNVEFLSGRF